MKNYMKVAVGGTIGVGKSTFCDKLFNRYQCSILRELPDDRDHLIYQFLDEMYNNRFESESMKNHSAFAFQTYLLGYRQQELTKQYNFLRVFDRTVLEDKYFANKLINDTFLVDKYNEMWDKTIRDLADKDNLPDFYLILAPDFKGQTIHHIIKRGRESELEMLKENLDYFLELEAGYVDYLVGVCKEYNIPYRVLHFTDMEFQTGIVHELENHKRKTWIEIQESGFVNETYRKMYEEDK